MEYVRIDYARARISVSRERLLDAHFFLTRARWYPILKDLDKLGDLGRSLRETFRDSRELDAHPRS